MTVTNVKALVEDEKEGYSSTGTGQAVAVSIIQLSLSLYLSLSLSSVSVFLLVRGVRIHDGTIILLLWLSSNFDIQIQVRPEFLSQITSGNISMGHVVSFYCLSLKYYASCGDESHL